MNPRVMLIGILFVAAGATTWLLRELTQAAREPQEDTYHDPDYYMEDFTTLTMDQDGRPKSKLYAVYMAHYPDGDMTELLKPRMEIFRVDKRPLFVTAERGWVTADNEVILLRGDVRLWEDNEAGARVLQVDTSEARVLINDEYAETDQPATIRSGRSTITGTGMRAYFNESRLEVLDHERTTIEPAAGG